MASKAQVDAALASGEWKAKVDAKSGRTYYVNTQTKKTCWNLAKELAAASEPVAVEPRAAVKTAEQLREERHDRSRRRSETEQALRDKVSQLESHKVELETEIARLKGPVEHEVEALAELRRAVGDQKFAVETVAREAAEKRATREKELHAAQAKVQSLLSIVEDEKAHRDAVEARQRQLTAEGMELKADVSKELANTEALRSSVRVAERKVEEAKSELARNQSELAARQAAVSEAEKTLVELSKRRSEAQESIERMKQQKEFLSKQLAGGSKAQGAQDTLAQLTIKYDEKVKTLKRLSSKRSDEQEAALLTRSCQLLRGVRDDLERDKADLDRALRSIQSECVRVASAIVSLRETVFQLEDEAVTLENVEPWPHVNMS